MMQIVIYAIVASVVFGIGYKLADYKAEAEWEAALRDARIEQDEKLKRWRIKELAWLNQEAEVITKIEVQEKEIIKYVESQPSPDRECLDTAGIELFNQIGASGMSNTTGIPEPGYRVGVAQAGGRHHSGYSGEPGGVGRDVRDLQNEIRRVAGLRIRDPARIGADMSPAHAGILLFVLGEAIAASARGEARGQGEATGSLGDIYAEQTQGMDAPPATPVTRPQTSGMRGEAVEHILLGVGQKGT